MIHDVVGHEEAGARPLAFSRSFRSHGARPYVGPGAWSHWVRNWARRIEVYPETGHRGRAYVVRDDASQRIYTTTGNGSWATLQRWCPCFLAGSVAVAHETHRLIARSLDRPIELSRLPEARRFRELIRERFPTAEGADGLDQLTDAQWDESWSSVAMRVHFDGADRPVPSSTAKFDGVPPLRRKTWCIGMSLRCPILVEECFVWSTQSQEYLEKEPDLALLELGSEIAAEFRLTIVPARELHRWKVDPALMTERMWQRLDHTDVPTAYSLLMEG